MEEEEKTNSYMCILKRLHDKKESREVTSQRYLMMFNGYHYKCNNYGHKSIHCRDHEKITPGRNQDGFSLQCFNCYHYDHFAKHCRMQGPVKVWRRNKVQLNDMNNHQPTKV